MRIVETYNLESGMVLARDIYLLDGLNKVLLLKKGMTLTNKYIEKLENMRISGVFVRDGINDDVEVSSVLSEEQKEKAIDDIKEVFDKNGKRKQDIELNDIQKLDELSKEIVNIVLCSDTTKIGITELKSYDDYTYHHSLSVAVLSVAIGIGMGLDEDQLEKLGLSAILHDIGKLMIDVSLINKPYRLTPDEFITVSQHSKFGGEYLQRLNLVDADVYSGVLYHHEKLNGTGYPYGIKGKAIPLFARIIAVADVYDALTSNRPYRKPAQPFEAFEYIMGGVDSHFDFEVVQAFAKKIAPYPNGSCVHLSNGDVGIVIDTNPDFPLRPMVKSIHSGDVYKLWEDSSFINITVLGSWGEFDNVKTIR